MSKTDLEAIGDFGATSKLDKAEDVERIQSFGFRVRSAGGYMLQPATRFKILGNCTSLDNPSFFCQNYLSLK
jgi:hypothetical protein